MSLGLRILFALVSVGFLFFVLMMIRRRKFLLKYSFFWLALSIVGLIAAIWPDWVLMLSVTLGFEVPVNFLFFVCIILLMGVSLTLCGVVSAQARRLVSLVQEVSILRAEYDGDVSKDANRD